MQISEILSVRRVYIDLKAEDKRSLLAEMAKRAARYFGIDERMVFDSLLERESLGATGFGKGFALPHARLPNIKRVKIFFARLDKPIDFEAKDGQPVDLVCLLLSPEDSGADHLSALAAISGIIKQDDKLKKIRKSKSKDDIYAILSK